MLEGACRCAAASNDDGPQSRVAHVQHAAKRLPSARHVLDVPAAGVSDVRRQRGAALPHVGPQHARPPHGHATANAHAPPWAWAQASAAFLRGCPPDARRGGESGGFEGGNAGSASTGERAASCLPAEPHRRSAPPERQVNCLSQPPTVHSWGHFVERMGTSFKIEATHSLLEGWAMDVGQMPFWQNLDLSSGFQLHHSSGAGYLFLAKI